MPKYTVASMVADFSLSKVLGDKLNKIKFLNRLATISYQNSFNTPRYKFFKDLELYWGNDHSAKRYSLIDVLMMVVESTV